MTALKFGMIETEIFWENQVLTRIRRFPMIIRLTTGYAYDTSNSDHCRRLKLRIKHFIRQNDDSSLAHIKTQIERSTLVKKEDISIYSTIPNTQAPIVHFQQEHIQQANSSNGFYYTYLNGNFYKLYKTRYPDRIKSCLIDKLIYESMRHKLDEEPCLSLRLVINKFVPDSLDFGIADYEENLRADEIEHHTFFGDNLSDDSDSEYEETFVNMTSSERQEKLRTARQHKRWAGYDKYKKAIEDKAEKPPKPDLETRPIIVRDEDFDQSTVQADLDRLNKELKRTKKLTPDFLAKLKTKFFVAQYRGIHYVTSRWDADARRKHRDMDEVGKPQYSSAVFEATNVKSYHQYIDNLENDDDFEQRLTSNAEKIHKLLLAMQHSLPVAWGGYVYLCLFYLLQYWYSYDYDGLPSRLDKDFKEENSHFSPYLLNAARPLLSTGDIPYHACKYAYGVKLYEGHEDERLRPRWRRNGRAERPYSGKIYVSLHPLTDYTEQNPSHITSLFKHGFVRLSNLIAPERETSFLGYMPSERVVYQHKAKYPSFKGNYKSSYEEKYGIDRQMYNLIKNALREHPPHSKKRRRIKAILGEYFCSYQEVRLIDIAADKAREQNAVLIYRDEDGLFCLTHPDTPTTKNTRLGEIIRLKRQVYTELAPNSLKQITKLNQSDIGDLTEAQQIIFFGNKNVYDMDNLSDEKVEAIPNPTLT